MSLVLKEWQFSDGSISLGNSVISRSQPSFYGSPNLQLRTGRKLKVAVAEGRNLFVKEKSGKCDPYVKLQYGKVSCHLVNSHSQIKFSTLFIFFSFFFFLFVISY